MESEGRRGAEYYEPSDLDYLAEVIDRFFGPLTDLYFRPRLIGFHKLPADGPAILAPNHSGSSFPYDGMVLDSLLWRREGRPADKWRSVYEKVLSQTWWMRPFGVDNFWRRGGGVDMTFDNFDRLLARRERVIYYPEGVPGIGKGFRRRYQLQRFSSSFVIMAARHQAPVYPVSVVNAEWVIPLTFMLGPLDWLMWKGFRVPFMPLPWGPLAVAFPFLWYLALPARMVFVIGDPIDVAGMVREEGVTDLENPDRETMRRVAERVRRIAQPELTRHVERYGRAPYGWRTLRRAFRQAGGRRHLFLPPTWIWKFVRLERDRRRPDPRNRLHGALRDWDLAAFYLPLGWPILSLCRRLRQPPYGYRGLSRRQRREREGAFQWDLAERPLPPRRRRETDGAESEM